MGFIKTPLSYESDSLIIARNLKERIAMIDNFIELIIFSSKGSFVADGDFGFEYWNHEYSNIHFRSFNSGQNLLYGNGTYSEVTLQECKESIEKSLAIYEPQLKQVGVLIELDGVKKETNSDNNKIMSKYKVSIKVTGVLEDGLGTFTSYKKEVSFLMEPTAKRINK